MGEEILRKLVEFIENASPVIWAAASRQVAVNAIRTILAAIVFLVATLVLARLAAYCNKRYHEDERESEDWNVGRWTSITLGLVFFVIFLILAIGVIGPLVNPDYYAIQVLINLVR